MTPFLPLHQKYCWNLKSTGGQLDYLQNYSIIKILPLGINSEFQALRESLVQEQKEREKLVIEFQALQQVFLDAEKLRGNLETEVLNVMLKHGWAELNDESRDILTPKGAKVITKRRDSKSNTKQVWK